MDALIAMKGEDRRLVCEQAANTLGLAAASVEKDLWVCWTLRELFGLADWGEHLAFKGGTSLSKGWKLIDRFSEDIDVVISRELLGFEGETLSNNRQKKLIKTCSAAIHDKLLPALEDHFRTRIRSGEKWSLYPASKEEDSDRQTLLFEYPRVLGNDAAYIQPRVKIEMGARSATEPVESPTIQAYICEALPDIAGDGKFVIRTVAARRTFWDKVMLLHEETFRPADRPAFKPRMARHYYDVWSLIRKGVAAQALADSELFERVAAHREAFFGHSWVDYKTLRPGSLRVVPLATQLTVWQADYQSMQTEMFFGDVPKFEEILRVVGEFERDFNSRGTS